jgi:hypothetical protein
MITIYKMMSISNASFVTYELYGMGKLKGEDPVEKTGCVLAFCCEPQITIT